MHKRKKHIRMGVNEKNNNKNSEVIILTRMPRIMLKP